MQIYTLLYPHFHNKGTLFHKLRHKNLSLAEARKRFWKLYKASGCLLRQCFLCFAVLYRLRDIVGDGGCDADGGVSTYQHTEEQCEDESADSLTAEAEDSQQYHQRTH